MKDTQINNIITDTNRYIITCPIAVLCVCVDGLALEPGLPCRHTPIAQPKDKETKITGIES